MRDEGWLKRQSEEVEADLKELPAWVRRNAASTDDETIANGEEATPAEAESEGHSCGGQKPR